MRALVEAGQCWAMSANQENGSAALENDGHSDFLWRLCGLVNHPEVALLLFGSFSWSLACPGNALFPLFRDLAGPGS